MKSFRGRQSEDRHVEESVDPLTRSGCGRAWRFFEQKNRHDVELLSQQFGLRALDAAGWWWKWRFV